MPRQTRRIATAMAVLLAAWIAFGFVGGGPEPVGKLPWLDDLPAALTKAKTENKRVLVDFTGSDWCPPCQSLRRRVLTTQEFEAYAETNLVLVVVDFPKGKPQSEELKKSNQALSEKFNVQGFPTVVVLDTNEKVLSSKVGYDGGTAKEFVENLKQLK